MEVRQKLYEVNIMENKKLVWGLNFLALLLVVPIGFLFAMIGVLLSRSTVAAGEFTLLSMAYLFVFYFALIIIHELIHGIFFKVFCPENPVKYGLKWKSGMAYATSPGSLYNRMQMLVISLAPFVVISLALTMLFALGLLSPIFYFLLATMHGASCAGDFYYAWLLLVKFRKEDICVEDTETGLLIYQA
ncbi:metalloprotease family protein [Streptococcus suis]|uniref:metalloprotease family protein n=1 Tax=Streptococcus suis TaxID=1307 RepID=UPI0014793B23|nr:DUF3267 domain-containing protein [Streptococcus suis]